MVKYIKFRITFKGMANILNSTGNRIAWITLNQEIPQSIDINQIKNDIFVKYPRQPS